MINFLLFIVLVITQSISHAGDCKPSFNETLGDNWKAEAPYNVDVGEGLLIYGRILSSSNCKPIANARIEHWQSGADGVYHDKQRAYMFSDKDGNYKFNTIWPGLRHIHFIISAGGYQELSTHWRWKDFETTTDKSEFDIVVRPLKQE